jgi:hypothetical protein
MCLCHRQLDPKTRRRMVIANIALILGILLWNSERWNWVHAISQLELNCLHAFTGLCFGFYITITLFGVRRGCRNRAVGSGEL